MFRGSRLCWTQRLSPLCPAGDAIQPPADGTTDFPLFLHPPDELHPLRPAQLSVPSEDTSEAGQQSPRPFPHGRRRAAVPLPPGIRVSPQPVPEAHLPSRKLLERGGGALGPTGLPCYVCSLAGRRGDRGPVFRGCVCAGWSRCGGEPGGPPLGPSPGPESSVWCRKAAVCLQQVAGAGTGRICPSPFAWCPAGYGQVISLQLFLRPQRQQPTRLPSPWDSPGKNTGVGCHFLLQCMKVKSESEVAQLLRLSCLL